MYQKKKKKKKVEVKRYTLFCLATKHFSFKEHLFKCFGQADINVHVNFICSL